jgi:hypothetical protein
VAELNPLLPLPVPEGIDYLSAGKNSCFSAAIAFIMHQMDCPRAYWQPQAIDAVTGRRPGELTTNTNLGSLLLLDQGLTLTEIFPDLGFGWDISQGGSFADYERCYRQFIAQSPVAKDYYEYSSEDLRDHWETLEKFLPYEESGQYTEKDRLPDIDDVIELVRDGPVLAYTKVGEIPDASHAVVVAGYGIYPRNNEPRLRYFNCLTKPPYIVAAPDAFAKQWLPDQGIIGVRRK